MGNWLKFNIPLDCWLFHLVHSKDSPLKAWLLTPIKMNISKWNFWLKREELTIFFSYSSLMKMTAKVFFEKQINQQVKGKER